MSVFACDRDRTVDVNPYPLRKAVLLGWVRRPARDTVHAAYAIGTRALADEAAVPGVVDIVGMHPDDRDDWLGDKRPTGRYEQGGIDSRLPRATDAATDDGTAGEVSR